MIIPEDFNPLESYGFKFNDDYDFGAKELALDVGLEGYPLRSPTISKLMRKCPR